MKVIAVKKRVTDAEMDAIKGTHVPWDPTKYKIVHSDADMVREDGTFLARFRKRVIPDTAIRRLAYLDGVKKVISRNRGHATGEESQVIGRFVRSAPSTSTALGFINPPNMSECRQTAYTVANMDSYKRSYPFFGTVDRLYKKLFPKEHAAQRDHAQRAPDFCIGNTVFSTVTVNHSFRTGVHRDSNDFPEGMGNLTVVGKGFKGGFLLFPQYAIAIDVQEGDFVGMDVHEWHCNSPLDTSKGDRISIVCYLRKNIHLCQEALAYSKVAGGLSTDGIIAKLLTLASRGRCVFTERRVNDMKRYNGQTTPRGAREYVIHTKEVALEYTSPSNYKIRCKQSGRRFTSLSKAVMHFSTTQTYAQGTT